VTCIKTGARIYFENYRTLVVGDAFCIGNCFIFRWNASSIRYDQSPKDATHIVDFVENSSNWWHRDDLGVTVVPAHLVTAGDME